MEQEKVRNNVQEYYGKLLQKTSDLKSNACLTSNKMPNFAKASLSKIHEEVLMKYYGCGVVLPEALEGLKILDLGSGSGRDVYLLSSLVGEKGYVVGVDMTEEQIQISQKYIDYHTKQFGFSKSNVEFKKGYIEKLDELNLNDATFDIIISNCVVNLSPNKEAVLEQAFRLLKPGGEMYFSDVYSDRRIPQTLKDDPVLWGECISGALYWNDFHRLAHKVGFKDPRIVESSIITVNNSKLQDLLGNIRFWSVTYRLFKIDSLEDACEDYGEAVQYKGTIPHHPHGFALDGQHYFETGKFLPVCHNTRLMLSESRFSSHFIFSETNTHFGIFGGSTPFDKTLNSIPSSKVSGKSEPEICKGGGCC